MKAYPKYKPTTLKWIETIPAHWDCVRAQYIFNIVSGSTPNSNDETLWNGNINWITPADFNTKDHYISKGERTISQKGYESCSTTLVPAGSIIFSKRAPIGKVVIASEELCTNQGCFGCIPAKELSNNYFYYLIGILEPQYNLLGSGSTFLEISAKEFSSFRLLFPSIEEQETIAEYLDEVTGKIDALVAEKQALVDELRAYRTSLITESVTRGLNPNAPLKNSGIDWLGDIPEHWKVVKTSYCFDTIGSGTTPTSTEEDFYEHGTINWLQTGDLNDGIISNTSKKVTEMAVRVKGLKTYHKGSLVIAMYGATIAKLGLLAIETTVNQACCVLQPSKDILSNYAFYVFWSAKQELISLASGGSQPNISQATISNLRIPVPSISEQQEIIAFLDAKIAKIDEAIAELEAQLKDLVDYKQAVITEAVTGKVDVRDWKTKN